MPLMPKRRLKDGSEPLVFQPLGERRGLAGPGPGGLRRSFQAQTRGLDALTPRERDRELQRQGILESGDVQARRARRGR